MKVARHTPGEVGEGWDHGLDRQGHGHGPRMAAALSPLTAGGISH